METFWNLFDNTILFFAMISLIFIWPIEIDRNKWPYKVIMGTVLSVMAAFAMFNSVHVGNGLYIDARYAIPIITIIFFGTVPGVMVVTTIILVRIFALGGAGVPIGVSYAIVQGLVTFAYKKYHYDVRKDTTLKVSLQLLLLAVVLQVMLTLSPLIFLPIDIARSAIVNNWFYLITIYPGIVFLFSMIVGFRRDYYNSLEAGRLRDHYLKLTLQRSPTPMAIYDADGNCIHLNDAWVEQSGYDRTEFKTMWDWLDLVAVPEEDNVLKTYNTIDDIIQTLPESEYKVLTKHNGVRVWSFERKEAGVLPDGTNIFVSVAKDVTDRKEYEEELLKISYHDFLTGLHNRRYYDEVFQHMELDCENMFVLYGDMNNLKSLNDYYGHNRGDEAIVACAKVLTEVFDDNSIIFRFGGDEFLIITECAAREDVIEKMDDVSKKISTYDFGEVSIGITLGMQEFHKGDNLDTAIMKAESRMYEYKIFESTSARSGTVDVILTMLFEKDRETERHSNRVQEILRRFAKELELNTNDSNLLLRAGLLHDIGKILTPTSIILSKDKLTEEQYDIIKKHPYLGYRILSSKGHMKAIGEIVLAHHEHVDGNGYPNGLQGEDIPYFARILSIVDAFEAMTSDRPYRSRKSFEEAKQELLRCSGTQFDATLVELFLPIIPDLQKYTPSE